MSPTPPVTPPDVIGSKDVCDVVGFDRSTLSRWIKDGTAVPFARLSSGAYLFTAAEADRLAKVFKEREGVAA